MAVFMDDPFLLRATGQSVGDRHLLPQRERERSCVEAEFRPGWPLSLPVAESPLIDCNDRMRVTYGQCGIRTPSLLSPLYNNLGSDNLGRWSRSLIGDNVKRHSPFLS